MENMYKDSIMVLINGKVINSITNETFYKLAKTPVKEFYRSDYTLIDFICDCVSKYSWMLTKNREYTLKEFIDVLVSENDRQVKFLYDDIIKCLQFIAGAKSTCYSYVNLWIKLDFYYIMLT